MPRSSSCFPRSLGVASLVCVLLAGCKGEGGTVSADQKATSSPKAVVAMFVEAWNRHDSPAMTKLVLGAKPNKALDETVAKGKMSIAMESSSESLSGSEAHVTFQSKLSGAKPPRDRARSEDLLLHMDGTGWKIVADPKNYRVRRGYVQFLVNQVARPAETPSGASKIDAVATCAESLKKISMGMIFYLVDHKSTYPASFASIRSNLLPYIKDTTVWTCPADKRGSTSYSFNPGLMGVVESTVDSPSTLVMVYEGHDGKLSFLHDGKAGIAFDDGSVKMVTPGEAKSLRWKVK